MVAPRHTFVALALVGALVMSACGREAVRNPLDSPVVTNPTTPGETTPPGFTPEPIDWSDCAYGECARVRVPLDYTRPGDRPIELSVVRVPASGERIGALFVNPGGPGATAIDFASGLAPLLPTRITEHFDIVGVDPRGVGESNPIRCGIDIATLYGVDPTIDSPADRTQLLDVSKKYVDDCTIKFGDVLPFVGTRDVARDMDTVRAAMGDDQLSYLGFSYGTAIGQVYADLFPTRVRSMVLDGVLELGPSGLALAAGQAAGFETALARFVAYCNGAEGCEISGNAGGVVEQVLALAEEPGGIPAPDADRQAGPEEAILGIGLALYSRSLWPDLDAALAEAVGGDGSELVALADKYIYSSGFEIYFAVNCIDFEWPTDPDAVLQAAKASVTDSPHFGEALINDYIRCADWPVPADPLGATSAPGTPPILVISTTGDPATPYEAGVNVAKRLASGVLITNEGDGHTVVAGGKPCIADLLVAYLVEGTSPPNGTTCR
ncbi:MAG: alpha/beta hydrolase [Acidimicrobiales bacterium]